jgi:phosphohistidine phosphatase
MFRWMLLRHAKSDWSNANQSDFDRPLNARGKKAAPQLGLLMLEHGYLPDTILSSTAVRAQETMQGLLAAWDPSVSSQHNQHPSRPTLAIQSTESLYLASPTTILLSAQLNQEKSQSMLVIGHNPGMEMLASQLAGSSITMKTAQLIVFESETGWPKLPGLAESWVLKEMLRPERE